MPDQPIVLQGRWMHGAPQLALLAAGFSVHKSTNRLISDPWIPAACKQHAACPGFRDQQHADAGDRSRAIALALALALA